MDEDHRRCDSPGKARKQSRTHVARDFMAEADKLGLTSIASGRHACTQASGARGSLLGRGKGFEGWESPCPRSSAALPSTWAKINV